MKVEIESSGLTLRGIDVGPSEASAIFFIHAFPLNRTMWQPQIDALQQEHRVVALDVRGLGESDSGRFPATMDHLADDVFRALDALQINRPVLCGCSLGGYIAQRAVSREMDRFAAVVLCDTRCEADDNTAKLNRSNGIRKIANEGLAAYAAEFAPKLFSPSAAEKRPDLLELTQAMMLTNSPEAVCQMLMTLACRADYEAALPGWKLPAYVVCGAEDILTPPLLARKMAGLIPGARYEEIPAAGHLANLENPTAFVEVLKRALSGK